MSQNIKLLAIIALSFVVLVGCSSSPPPEDLDDDLASLLNTAPPEKQDTEEPTEELVQETPEEVIEEQPKEPVMSGSLDLQSDLDLCPHVRRSFSCDKYAIKICDPSEFGFAGFLPDHVSCRTSDISGHDICKLRECGPIADEGGIVTGYGGIVARVEYSQVKTSVDSKVWHDYTLVRCGEMEESFDEKDDCIFAK